ncbi:hypothetical protein [Conexibacter sp. CPCC 206217]|uniref:hypothetical protein n=1 Tax=Conexibacter sp. CPCC 206217 TaxID=3064574 RepID=UPI002727553D|nr:hypothetical protein [Conexibacter sp. CPCC 206217]MDO8210155.1 hypothetical protein [Conexibacter sp. CPCC 206217]
MSGRAPAAADAPPAEEAAPKGPEPLFDDAIEAAEGTRRAALWVASALGAIPSIAIVGAIVRDPGRGGFDELELIFGVFAAAVGALVGVLGLANVIAPVALKEGDLKGFLLAPIPGAGFETYDELRKSTAKLRTRTADEAYTVATLKDDAATARAVAVAAAADASVASETRAELALKSAEAEATATSGETTLATMRQQLDDRYAVRRAAYRLKASQRVGVRFRWAWATSFAAVLLVATGVALLGLAPLPDPESRAAPAPVLMQLTLERAGQDRLGCSVTSLQALRIGGSDEAPKVITLPRDGCPARTLTFTTTRDTGLGRAKPVDPIEED